MSSKFQMEGNVPDALEIQQILTRYVLALGCRQPSELTACFASHAELDLSGVNVTSVEDYIRLCKEGLAKLDATHHQLGMPAIHREGDRAWSRCYFTAQHVSSALLPNGFLLIGGWYDDELVRTEDGWRISRRRGIPVFIEGNPAVLGMDFPIGAPMRCSGHAMPQWARANPDAA